MPRLSPLNGTIRILCLGYVSAEDHMSPWITGIYVTYVISTYLRHQNIVAIFYPFIKIFLYIDRSRLFFFCLCESGAAISKKTQNQFYTAHYTFTGICWRMGRSVSKLPIVMRSSHVLQRFLSSIILVAVVQVKCVRARRKIIIR